MVFSKFLDGLPKVWRENPFTAEWAKCAEIFSAFPASSAASAAQSSTLIKPCEFPIFLLTP